MAEVEALESRGPVNGNGEGKTFDLLLDVPLSVTVELGRIKMPVRTLLALGAIVVLLVKPSVRLGIERDQTGCRRRRRRLLGESIEAGAREISNA